MAPAQLVPRAYRAVLREPAVRRALAAGLVLRLPITMCLPVLTILCVVQLHVSYAGAGLATAAFTIADAVMSPWRGRSLSRRGVRRTCAPLVPFGVVAWGLVGHVPFTAVVICCGVAALAGVPFWTVGRQLVLVAAPASERTVALSLDSVATELAFVIGPALGVYLATAWSPTAAVTIAGAAVVINTVALCALDPELAPAPTDAQPVAAPAAVPVRRRLVPLVGLTFLCAVTAVGFELALLATLRESHHVAFYSVAAALLSAGSVAGGLVYGAVNRRTSPMPLAALFGALVLPLVVVHGQWLVAAAAAVAGLACAPTLTAISDAVAHQVAPVRQAEAFGWCASASTAGMAVAGTAGGALVDLGGPHLLAATLGATTITGAVLLGRHSMTRAPDPEPASCVHTS